MTNPSLILDKSRVEHRRVTAACDALEALMAEPHPGAGEGLMEHRWNFTREMLLHFANFDTVILQPLMADRRTDIAARAARSSHDLRNVYDIFSRHTRRWHGLPPVESWNEYRQAIALLIRRVRVRLAAEETEIHSMLPCQPGGRRVAAAVEPVNYAAEAWRIRSLVYPSEFRISATG